MAMASFCSWFALPSSERRNSKWITSCMCVWMFVNNDPMTSPPIATAAVEFEKDPVEPFIVYGSIRKKYSIEHIVKGKIVGRKKGFTASACINVMEARQQSPTVPFCVKGEGQTRKESCSLPCCKACQVSIGRHVERVDETTGYELDKEDINRVQSSCSSQCLHQSHLGQAAKKQDPMDVVYVSHGSPMLPFEEIPARDFFKGFSNLITPKPKAIVVISAHWETSEPTVSTCPQNSTIYDFYGFPRELYQLKYEAPGAPQVAKRVKELLKSAGFSRATEDPKRGLDHGAWVPLLLAYPKADIPVCQVSLQSHKDGEHHYKLGRALAPLSSEGVLIFASGTTTHNLRNIQPTAPSWAKDFEEWLHHCLLNKRYDDVVHYMQKGPHAKMNHPTPDHFLPLIVALGAAGEHANAKAIHRSWHASFSMSCYSFNQ